MKSTSAFALVFLISALAACSGGDSGTGSLIPTNDGGAEEDTAAAEDASAGEDATAGEDAGAAEDAAPEEDTTAAEDAGIEVIEPGDFCDDPAAGSGTTPTPTPAAENSFTTELVACSLSAAEAGACYGAVHSSSVTVTDTTIEITSNAIPNHDAGIFPNIGNPNEVTPQALSWSIPLTPTFVGTPTTVRIPGVGLNGIKMEPDTAERYADGEWRYEALTFMGRLPADPITMPVTTLGADCNFAHVQPTGEYHYHGNPSALMPPEPARVQVGWAADGYPIYGRFGYADAATGEGDLIELTGSYRVREGERASLGGDDTPPGAFDGTFQQDWEFVDGLGDLDTCNGRAESNVIDGRTYDYAYYLTHTYPFMPRCLMGEPAAFAGGGQGGGGQGPGATACNTPDDCEGACGDAPRGCDCVTTPEGDSICAALCESDDDCDEGFRCGREGWCVPEGGPGGGGRP